MITKFTSHAMHQFKQWYQSRTTRTSIKNPSPRSNKENWL